MSRATEKVFAVNVYYHRRSGELPACFLPDDVEKSYDRRMERFIEAYPKGERADHS